MGQRPSRTLIPPSSAALFEKRERVALAKPLYRGISRLILGFSFGIQSESSIRIVIARILVSLPPSLSHLPRPSRVNV